MRFNFDVELLITLLEECGKIKALYNIRHYTYCVCLKILARNGFYSKP